MKLVTCVAAGLLVCASAFAQSPPDQTPSPSPTVAATPVVDSRVLYPATSAHGTPALVRATGDPTGLPGLAMSFLVLLALCAGGFYLLRRQGGFTPAGKGQRKLVVSESRALGNRQFLVVVEYESERVLLGVTPGKIDYLCPLPFKEQAS